MRKTVYLIIQIIFGLLLAASAVFLPNVLTKNPDIQVVIGFLLTIIGFLGEILLNTMKNNDLLKQDLDTKIVSALSFSKCEEFHLYLYGIDNSFRQILNIGDHDVFENYFIEEIKGVHQRIENAATLKEITGPIQHIVTEEYVLSCFGNRSKIWSFTWPVSSVDEIFSDDTWMAYFSQATDLLRKRKIIAINIVFLLDKVDFTGFFNSIRGSTVFANLLKTMCLKHITLDRYQSAYRQAFNLSANATIPTEIGIYGDNLLFIYEQNSNNGKYIKDVTRIERHKVFFDAVFREARHLTLK